MKCFLFAKEKFLKNEDVAQGAVAWVRNRVAQKHFAGKQGKELPAPLAVKLEISVA